ncbi:MAG: AMP-binding enzyme [Lentihominibacter sp.]
MGYRIELGEIEAAAISLKGIKSAAAVCDSESGRILLICEGKVKEPEQISETLKKKIPSYMLPDEIIKIKVMPYNANGKIDRAKLKKYITTDRKMR